MKEYFLLQHKMFNRKMIDFGIPVVAGYVVLPIVFVLLSNLLFSKTEFAGYFYVFIALFLIFKLSEFKRNDFLKTVFSKSDYFKLRCIENIVLTLPFFIYLLYKEQFILAALLEVCSAFLAIFKFKVSTNFVVPTPFGKKPFEFTVGFRKTFFIFPIAYILTYISIYVDNFNLGVFCLGILALTCLSYYSKPEDEYFVWSFKEYPKSFLLKKIKACLINFTLLSIPIVIALSVFFFKSIIILLGILLLCYVYLATVILTKYSAYPEEVGFSQGLMFGLTFIFPPLLFVVIPLFWAQSIKNLNLFLDD